MASADSTGGEMLEPARKRQKLSPSISSTHYAPLKSTVTQAMAEARQTAEATMVSQLNREAQTGILCFVNETNPGFSGILKQRYEGLVIQEGI